MRLNNKEVGSKMKRPKDSIFSGLFGIDTLVIFLIVLSVFAIVFVKVYKTDGANVATIEAKEANVEIVSEPLSDTPIDKNITNDMYKKGWTSYYMDFYRGGTTKDMESLKFFTYGNHYNQDFYSKEAAFMTGFRDAFHFRCGSGAKSFASDERIRAYYQHYKY